MNVPSTDHINGDCLGAITVLLIFVCSGLLLYSVHQYPMCL